MKQAFILFWCLAGLVTLDLTLRQPAPAATAAAPPDTVRAANAIRTSCELPAGTLVFVVRDAAGAR